MHSILHKITIEAPKAKVYEAISTEKGLTNWWTKAKQTEDDTTFFFGPNGEHQVKMKTITDIPGKEIKWRCSEGPWADKGEFVFTISDDDRGVVLDFAHHGWKETDDFYKHCNPKWAYFLAISLKQYLETGEGAPHPQDPNI